MLRLVFAFLVAQLVFACAKKAEKENEPTKVDAKPITSIFPPDNPAGESTAEASPDASTEPAASADTATPASGTKKYTVTADVNVRKSGDSKSPILRKLKKNDSVTCVRQEPKGWCQLDGDGFVAMKFLK